MFSMFIFVSGRGYSTISLTHSPGCVIVVDAARNRYWLCLVSSTVGKVANLFVNYVYYISLFARAMESVLRLVRLSVS